MQGKERPVASPRAHPAGAGFCRRWCRCAVGDASVSSQDPQNQVSLRRSGGCVAVAAVAGGIGNSNGNVAVLMAIFLKRFIKS